MDDASFQIYHMYIFYKSIGVKRAAYLHLFGQIYPSFLINMGSGGTTNRIGYFGEKIRFTGENSEGFKKLWAKFGGNFWMKI